MSCSELMGDDRRVISRSGWNGNLWAWEHSGDSGTFLEGFQMGLRGHLGIQEGLGDTYGSSGVGYRVLRRAGHDGGCSPSSNGALWGRGE